MPLTKLDPVAALIVIDLQKGIVAIPTAHPTSEIVDRAAQLARAFRERGLPVVLVNERVRLQVAPTSKGPNFRSHRIGLNLFLNWNSTPTIM
jgi:nicotinamidase-related amidase